MAATEKGDFSNAPVTRYPPEPEVYDNDFPPQHTPMAGSQAPPEFDEYGFRQQYGKNTAMAGYQAEPQSDDYGFRQQPGENIPLQQGEFDHPPPYGGGFTPSPYRQQYNYPPTDKVMYAQHGGPPVVVAALPARETGPAPDTKRSLIFCILSLIFCYGGWPFAVVAIVYNRKAKREAAMGQLTAARSSLRTAHRILIPLAIVVGTVAWIYIALRLTLLVRSN